MMLILFFRQVQAHFDILIMVSKAATKDVDTSRKPCFVINAYSQFDRMVFGQLEFIQSDIA